MTPELLQKTLSANMKSARKKLGLSQEKLAEKAGISVQMVNDIEGSRRWPSEKTLSKLADALSVEVYALFVPTVTSGNDTIHILKKNIAEELKLAIENTIENYVLK